MLVIGLGEGWEASWPQVYVIYSGVRVAMCGRKEEEGGLAPALEKDTKR
jgi:hypothetical protein